ncbi:hypothetical protein IAT38_002870 [Cryptococcus sp. DSM 104549]
MGKWKQSPPAPLEKVEPPVGIFPDYYARSLTTLVITEKVCSFSGDDFTIRDLDGTDIMICQGKTWSLRGRKALTDPTGELLMKLHGKLMSFPMRFYAEDENNNMLFEMKKKFNLVTHMSITFTDTHSEKPLTLLLDGDWWGGSADISLPNGTIIAQIKRKMLKAREILAGKQTYHVRIAPGVDTALIAAMCLCLDQSKNDCHRGGGGGGGGGG